MTRVSSQRTRQAILMVGSELDPDFLERFELFNADGTPFDSIKDLSRLRWVGDWSAAVSYTRNDVVRHEGGLFVAPDNITPGIEPGITASDPNVGTLNRGVQFKQSDRLHSLTPQTIIIGDPPLGQRRDNDISIGYSAAGLIDVTGTLPATILIVTPLATAPFTTFSMSPYDASNGYDMGRALTWTSAEVAAHTPKTVDFTGLTTDRYLHFFFSSGIDGSFSVQLSSVTNLESPPTVEITWEALVPVLVEDQLIPAGGTTGQLLTKESGTDLDVGWESPSVALPTGGSTGQYLTKSSGTDGDAGWTAPPHDLPVGGAMGYVLSKNSSTNYDVGWAVASSGGTDREKYLGEWNAATNYSQHDVVKYRGGIWIATGSVSAGTVPARYDRTDVQSYIIRGCRVWSSDRIVSTTDVTRVISALDDKTDISNRCAKIIWIDKSASVAGPNVTFTNNHPTAALNVNTYDAANGLQFISGTAAAAGGTATLTMPTSATDMFIVAYYTGVDAGSFRVKVNSATSLVAPPTPVNWEQIGSTVSISDTIIAYPGSTLTTGNESTVTVTHNNDLPNLDYLVVGHLEDGAYSHQCGWRIGARTKDTFQVTFKNNFSANAAMPILRAKMIY